MFFEERLRRVGADRVEIAVHRHADTLLALPHTEGARKLHLVTEIVVADKLPELFDHLTRTLHVARTTDSYRHFHCFLLLKF